jgi:hypothetical protein
MAKNYCSITEGRPGYSSARYKFRIAGIWYFASTRNPSLGERV